MGGFGERLRREREMRRVSLDNIAAATKIGTRSLRALEDEDFDKLPGGIFNKGFVRAYARFLGIDEEQAVSEYLTAAGEPAHEDPLDAERFNKLGANWKSPHQDLGQSEPLRVPWGLVVVVVLLGAMGVGGWKLYQGHKSHKQPPVAVQAASAPARIAVPAASQSPSSAPAATPDATSMLAAAQPSSTAPNTPTPTPNAAASEPTTAQPGSLTRYAAPEQTSASATGPAQLTLRIHSREKCWVRVTADGKPVVNTNLPPHKEITVPARKQLVLEAGNAGGIDVWLNDAQEPPLGPVNKYAKRTFSVP